MITEKTALYIHVPFCEHICHYCDFCHFRYRDDLAKRWLEAFRKEFFAKVGFKARTIYLGGGTPTALSSEILAEFLSIVDNAYSDGIEYTVEINPETFDKTKAELLKAHHVNRASIGLISADDAELSSLGRRHLFADVKKTVDLLNEVGIDNYSLDILYSFPTQTLTSFKNTLHRALSLKPKHFSLYSLTIEENTLFYKKGIKPFDEDTEAEYYETAYDFFESHGYKQYEVSNFALSGYESKHNLIYWHYEDFLGLSCGASSKIKNRRFDNTRDLNAYIKGEYLQDEIVLDKKDSEFEMIMMGMRLNEGVDLRAFKRRYGEDLKEVYKKTLLRLLSDGSVRIEDDHLICNNLEILNTILVEFMDQDSK